MTNKEAQKIADKLYKVCMRCWTSKEYQIPPCSKDQATIKTMEVMLFFWEAVGDFIKEADND